MTLRNALLALLVAIGLATGPGHAVARPAPRPADVAGFEAARWGMSEAALARAFGAGLARLPGRRAYGGAYATRYLADVALGDAGSGGPHFRAIFQMNAADDRLQQVLLEPLRDARPQAAFDAARDALEAEYGAPDGRCVAARPGDTPRTIELWWRFATTTIHLAFLDFYTSGMIFQQGRTDRPPVVAPRNPDNPLDKPVSGANPRLLPRRVLVRFHATANTALASPACPADDR